MSVIRWEVPPEKTHGRGKFDVTETLNEMKEHADDVDDDGNPLWGVIADGVSASYAHSSPLIVRLKGAGVEVRSVKTGEKSHTVYARYAGNSNADKSSESRRPRQNQQEQKAA